jgi:glucose/arabinose dehydrogenase
MLSKTRQVKKWAGFAMLVFLFFACQKPDVPKGPSSPGLDLIADNLVSPLGVTESPDGTKRLFITDQVGKVWIVSPDKTKLPEPFLDLTGKMVNLNPGYDERGLLGFAFHPNYKSNGRFFIYYTAPPRSGGPVPGVNWNNTSRLAEYRVMSGNPNKADISSERIILDLDHPQSNHNGGGLAFGPDGYLYLSTGDGGGSNDTAAGHVSDWYALNRGGNGQDVEANLLGDILRLDVNSGQPYGIPADNPFVGKPGKDEIYAFGFRNPYRFSFDMGGSRQLFVGDAGQLMYEEIDIVTKGGNYGWNVKEGTHCFHADSPRVERPSCPMTDNRGNLLINPVIELTNVNKPGGGVATTIIGGNVYRGKELPDYKGKYIFGIFSQTSGTPNGKIFKGVPSNSGLWSYEEISLINYPGSLGQYLKGFGQSEDGEIYLTTSTVAGPSGTTGKVLKLINTGIH